MLLCPSSVFNRCAVVVYPTDFYLNPADSSADHPPPVSSPPSSCVVCGVVFDVGGEREYYCRLIAAESCAVRQIFYKRNENPGDLYNIRQTPRHSGRVEIGIRERRIK